MLTDVHGKVHPVTMEGRQDILWARIIGTAITEAYLGWKSLQSFGDKVRHNYITVERLAQRVSGRSSQVPPLSQPGNQGTLNQLKHTVVASLPMRKFYVQLPPCRHDLIQNRDNVKAWYEDEQD